MMQEQVISLSPFGYAGIIATFLTFLVFLVFQVGRVMGGAGSFAGTLALIVWFQAVSLTLEAIQVVLVLFSPGMAALFGMISLGAIIWTFVNFINVLHGFANIGKSIVAIIMALLGTVIATGIVMAILGITVPGGTI
jgi:hypothetical protein